jgi:(p)ppGpp synthase/HD superfamily hydrolase
MTFIDTTDLESEAIAPEEIMAFAKPLYSRKKVNDAGGAIVRYLAMQGWNVEVFEEYLDALDIINNWRASHSGPLLAMRVLLTRQAQSIDEEALIAQRIKRFFSISAKLRRFPTMKLSQMQDIGGCRAILIYGI